MPFELTSRPAAAVVGRPNRRCTCSRMAHVGTRNCWCIGTPLRKAPACSCETAMKRTASRSDVRAQPPVLDPRRVVNDLRVTALGAV